MPDRPPLPALRAAAEAVAGRPLSLWLLLLAVNALFQPYMGLVHDARLYAAQTLHRIDPDAWASDLFFLHGSQDKYTIFSAVAAPVVRLLGLDAGFALLYLLGTGLYCFAAQRLCLRLVNDRLAAVAAAVLAVGWRVPFGGNNTFHVFEPFLTPRLFAIGFVLLALDGSLRGKWFTASGFLLVAFLLHPLMAFGGVLLVGGLGASRWPRLALSGTALLTAAVGVVIAVPSVGFRLLSEFDSEWREGVWRINPCNFPSFWSVQDVLRVAGSVGIAGLTAIVIPRLRLVAGLTAALGIVAYAGTVLAAHLPYVVPMQGQPYRALWLVAYLQIPFAFALLETWGTAADWPRRLAAGVIVGWTAISSEHMPTWEIGLLAMLAFGVFFRPRVLVGAAVGFTLVLCLNSAVMARGLVHNWAMLVEQFDPPVWLRLALETTNPVLRAAVAGGMFLAVARWPRIAVAFAIIAVVPPLVFGPLTQTELYRRLTPHEAERRFLAVYFRTHPRPDGRPPMVYWSGTELARVWFGLGANSYFHISQLNGNVFNRGNAIEGRRRARLVRPFELSVLKPVNESVPIGSSALAVSLEADGADLTSWPNPTAEDLVKLCADPALDWVVLWRPVPGFEPITNGKIYAYDARMVRERLTD